MTFAVVGILGHFSKTLLLFFIPQIFNFLLSCPQLFGVVPCPRHRMPWCVMRSNWPFHMHDTGYFSLQSALGSQLIVPSEFTFEHRPSTAVSILLNVLARLGIVRLTKDPSRNITSCTNLTLLNCMLVLRGPMSEQRLALECIGLQIAGSTVAFFIRYALAGLFYSIEDNRR
jgi:UDP-N-acetylglucosamine--dolichyl-phosphate N-acetylglucosaminephosphotransferase